MAEYHGYVNVNVSSYDSFRLAVNGNGFDCDGIAGAQCVDLFLLLNYNLGYNPPYAKAQPDGYAYELWSDPTSRAYNKSDKYDLIYRIEDLRRGDMIINGATQDNPYGHNAFCDSNYDVNLSYIPVLGQNQGGTPFPGGGAYADIKNWYLDNFLGAFRLKQWNIPITRQRKQGKFPWVLYARKLRK